MACWDMYAAFCMQWVKALVSPTWSCLHPEKASRLLHWVFHNNLPAKCSACNKQTGEQDFVEPTKFMAYWTCLQNRRLQWPSEDSLLSYWATTTSVIITRQLSQAFGEPRLKARNDALNSHTWIILSINLASVWAVKQFSNANLLVPPSERICSWYSDTLVLYTLRSNFWWRRKRGGVQNHIKQHALPHWRVAVLCGNWTLFHCVFRSRRCIWSTISLIWNCQ